MVVSDVTNTAATRSGNGSRNASAAGYRIAAIAGIGSMVLLLLSNFITPAAPSRGSAISAITSYYIQNHTGLLLAGYLGGLSMLLLFPFLSGLRSMLAAAEGEPAVLSQTAYTSGVVFSALALIAVAITITAVFKVAALGDPVLIRGLYDFNHQVLHLIWFPTAGLIGAGGLVALRSRAFPASYAWASFAAAIIMLIAAGGMFADKSNIITSLSLVGFLLTALWVIVTSALMYRR
jgi:hypothetical protein